VPLFDGSVKPKNARHFSYVLAVIKPTDKAAKRKGGTKPGRPKNKQKKSALRRSC
jgi:hypothetical protein